MLDGRSGRFLRGGSVREVAGKKHSKERLQPEEPVNPKPQPAQHAWHGKGLQKQVRNFFFPFTFMYSKDTYLRIMKNSRRKN